MNYAVSVELRFDDIGNYQPAKKHFVGCCTLDGADGNCFGLSCRTEKAPDEDSIKMNSLTHALQATNEQAEGVILEVCPICWLLPLLCCTLFFFSSACFWPFG